MCSFKITTIFVSAVLALDSLQCAAAASASSPAPEDPELLNSVFANHGFVNYDVRNAFWRDLETGDAPAASRLLENNIAPAYSTGERTLPCVSAIPTALKCLNKPKLVKQVKLLYSILLQAIKEEVLMRS